MSTDSRLRKQHKLGKENKAVKEVLNKSLVHQEGHHSNHSAEKTHQSSAVSHNAAHHS